MIKKVNQEKERKSPKRDNFVNFNKYIYQEQAILKTIADFGELADFDLKENKKYFVLAIKKNISGSKNFVDEFSNYVLGLTGK